MGYGVIDGRALDRMTGDGAADTESWYSNKLATQASDAPSSSSRAGLVFLEEAANFTLYKITLKNSPGFSVRWQGNYTSETTKGLTVWGVKIKAPYNLRNTAGVSVGDNVEDVTVADSFFSTGSDDVAISSTREDAPVSDISMTNLHTYSGSGIRVGSYTEGGIYNIVADTIIQSGYDQDPMGTGLTINSSIDRGGVVNGVTFQHVCQQNEKSGIRISPFSPNPTSTLHIPTYRNIAIVDTTILTPPGGTAAGITLQGYDANHITTLTLDNLNVLGRLNPSAAQSENVQISLGSNAISPSWLHNLSGAGVSYRSITSPTRGPYPCTKSSFQPLTGELMLSTEKSTNLQSLDGGRETTFTLTAILQPASSEYPPLTNPVSFYDGATTVGTAHLSGNGTVATFQISGATPGRHTYTARYPSDTNYPNYSFGTVSVTVANDSTSPMIVSAYVSAEGNATSLVAGSTMQASLYGVYSDGSVSAVQNTESNPVVAWNTSNHAVAQISLLGHVTAVAPGTVNIEAAIGGVVATPWKLAVTAASPSSTGAAAGTSSEGQYNSSGQLAGSSSLLFNPATGTVSNLTLMNPGTFGPSNYTSYLTSVVSGSSGSQGKCSFTSTWYQPITAAIYGCISAPSPGSGNRNTAGGFFTAYTQDNSASSYMEPVGIIGQGIALANGGSVYGANLLAGDLINCCNSGVVLVGQENDLQPTSASGPSAYLYGTAYRATIGFTNGSTGVYPFDGVELSSNQPGAYWRTGFNTLVGALGPSSVLLNEGAEGTASSTSGNFSCPGFANLHESYWSGAASENEQWDLFCTIGSGQAPNDYFRIGNQGGATGANHYFDLAGGIQLELDGVTSGSTILSVSPTGGTLNLGSANATVDAEGNLTVNSCTGCNVTSTQRQNETESTVDFQPFSTTGDDTGAFRLGRPFVMALADSTAFDVVAMTTTPGQVQAAPPGATNNIGIAQTVGQKHEQIYVQSYGISMVRFDGTPVVGGFACAPPAGTGTSGLAHYNGMTPCPAGQKLGVVTGAVSGRGVGATAEVLLELGG